MKSDDTKKGQNRQATEGFFIINIDIWERLFNEIDDYYSDSELIRVMATYLILCCGTGGDHITSSWSSGAVYKYAGISPKVAKRAIEILADYGFITIKKESQKNKLPVYKINSFDKKSKSDDTKNIFIPNGVVTGVTKEDSPLKRLVNEHNKHLLYLFVRLYYFQDKYLDVINPNIVSSALNVSNDLQAEMIYSFSNLLNVWCLDSPVMTGYRTSNFYDFNMWKDDIDDPFVHEKTESEHFFGFFEILRGLGLVDLATYAFNGEEVHYPRYSPDSDNVVSQLDFLTTLYSKQQWILLDEVLDLASDFNGFTELVTEYENKVVLPAKYKQVHFQSFYQLKYRTRYGESKIRYSQEASINKEMMQLLATIKEKG